MPINAGPEFAKANEEYLKASTTEEKLKALKLMLSTAPKHKSSEKLLDQLKKRYAESKKELAKEKKAGKKKSLAIKKEGAATVVLVSLLGTAKTELFCRLTNAKYEKENNYAVDVRMIPFENVWLQAIDLPAFYAGFASSSAAGHVFSLIRTADLVLFVVDVEEREKQLAVLKAELEKANIRTVGDHKNIPMNKETFVTYVASLTAYLGEEFSYEFVQMIKSGVWRVIGKIRVQTRTKAGIAPKPVVLKAGATVKELAAAIHHDFVRNFKHAKIWGESARFPGQTYGMEHKLQDNDTVEIFIH